MNLLMRLFSFFGWKDQPVQEPTDWRPILPDQVEDEDPLVREVVSKAFNTGRPVVADIVDGKVVWR